MKRPARSAPLAPETIRRAMRLSLFDAAAYASMVGLGEVFFVPNAVLVGASRLELGLVVALPLCIGALGPALAIYAMGHIHRRRPLVVATAAGQAVMLALLAAANAAGALGAWGLIAAASAFNACGQAAGALWGSWYGDLVPEHERGRYFSLRNRGAYLGTLLSLLLGGALLQWCEPTRTPLAAAAASRGGGGFALLYALAAGARFGSCWLLYASPEPPFGGTRHARVVPFLASRRGRGVRRLILTVAGLQLVVYVASPYFQPFMLSDLGFSYIEYTLACAVMILAKAALLPAWGRTVERTSAYAVGVGALFGLALVPLPWLWAASLGWVLTAQALSGLAWGGFELAQFTLVLENTYRRTRLFAFAALSALNGLAQLAGTLLGGALLVPLGFRRVFAVSLAARLAIAACGPRLLPRHPSVPQLGHRELVLRVLGFRPGGGLVHRPVAPEPTAHPESRTTDGTAGGAAAGAAAIGSDRGTRA
jgi:MFS family permease